MWKLTIEDDEGTKTLLPLVRDEYHVGRDEQNTIRLTERNISRRHASLKKNGDAAWHLVDHDSYNGCYVNGQRVAGHQKLSHADIIQLGDYRIFITSDAADADATGPNAATPAPIPPQEKPDRLVMVAGPEVGSEYPLNEGPVSIGRAEECGVSINHPSVSRFHAEVRPIGGGRYEITDKGSSNGVRVNTIDFRRTLLEHGDLIELGDVRLRFVEKGQIYRPMADMTQQLSALTGKIVVPSAAPVPKAKTGVVIGAVATGVLVLVGLVVVSMSGKADENADKNPPIAADDASKAALDAAKKAASVGDFDAAVAKLADIPVNSPARQSPEFADIHQRWADASFKKADELVDKSEKKALLSKVYQNTSVSDATRRKASELIAKLDGGTVDPTAPLPTAQPPSTVKGAGTYVPGPLPTDTSDHPPGKLPTDKTPGKKPGDKDPGTPGAPTTAATNPGDVPTTSDSEMKQRKALESKMNSGKASKDDLRLLKEICKHQSDAACKGRVNDAMKKLSNLEQDSRGRGGLQAPTLA